MRNIERNKEDILKALNAIVERPLRFEERQREDSDRLRRLAERPGRLEEERKMDSERLKRLEEERKVDSERLKRVEEGQIRGEEHMKGIVRNMSTLQEDIRALWQMAFGSFLGKKPDQESGNHPNDSSHS